MKEKLESLWHHINAKRLIIKARLDEVEEKDWTNMTPIQVQMSTIMINDYVDTMDEIHKLLEDLEVEK